MAQEIINVGTNPNDGTGDTLRGAFVKTDNNFDDLYTNKQNTLISGTNIKTINGNSVLGSGDLTIGGITGSGTTNYVSKFTAAGAIGNSQIFDNGTSVGIGTATPTSKLHVDGATDQILISGGTVQSIGSFAGGTMISYDDSNSDWDLFAGVFNYNVTSTSFYLNSILVNDVSNSVIFGAKNLPNATTISNASNETLIGVYHEITTDWETAIYAKRNIYCEDGIATTILTIAEPNSCVDLVAKIGYGSKFFNAKISLMIDWDALTYTYKITNTNTTTFDDSNSLNIDFEFAFAGAEFVVQINNDSGTDIYANINANIL